MNVPFLDLGRLNAEIRQSLDEAYHRVMDSGLFIMGGELAAFEAEFAAYSDVKHCIGVGNGLEAIHLLLRAYEIGPGDEVIVPSNTFIATWLAVSQAGAIPVAVEPNSLTYNIDPESIESAITPRTRAIIPVHLYGQTAEMDTINAIAAKHSLVVIEDAAQSQGSRYKGRCAGGLGNSAATSFYPGKNLGALGDAGAVLTNDDQIAEKVRTLRNYGSKIKYHHLEAGYNTRLDEMQAAFLRAKLSVLDVWNKKRQAHAARYMSLLSGSSVILPTVPTDMEPVWHLFVIRSEHRDELKAALEKEGVSTVIHYPIPPHKQACYSEYNHLHFPIAEEHATQVLSLPMFSSLREEEIEHVAAVIRNF